MDENLNLVEKLKDAPHGTKLWSSVFGDCTFINIDLTDVIYPIKCQITTTDRRTTYVGFTKDGRLDIQYENGGCILFPSEENMDWSTFRITKEHKCFEPFHKNMDKVINSNGFDYVDLGLPSKTLWATMNVGASKPKDYGLYFQWGDTQGYTADQVGTRRGQKKFSSYDYKWNPSGDGNVFTKYTTMKAKLGLNDDAANANMGGDWHMPTPDQISELLNNTTNTWTTQDGVNGRLFTSKTDTSKSIFIPAAGLAWDGSILNSGDYCNVWSSMLSSGNVDYGQYLSFYSGDASLSVNDRYFGLSVRGVLDKNDKNMNLSELIKNEIKNNFKVKVSADYGGYVNVELLYDGEVISSDVCQVITDFNSLDE